MGTVRQENAIYERRVLNAVLPAIQTLVLNATVTTPLYVRILVTNDTDVDVDNVTSYDLEDLKTIVDGLANGASDTGVVVAKDAQGVVSIST